MGRDEIFGRRPGNIRYQIDSPHTKRMEYAEDIFGARKKAYAMAKKNVNSRIPVWIYARIGSGNQFYTCGYVGVYKYGDGKIRGNYTARDRDLNETSYWLWPSGRISKNL